MTEQVVNGKDIAIAIQITSAIGPNRQINLGTGVPIDWDLGEINSQVDKMMAVIDRQDARGRLEVARSVHAKALFDLDTNIQQLEHFNAKCEQEFHGSGRKGRWTANGSQEKAIQNYRTTIQNFRENIIPKTLADIKDLEKIVAGT